jgi:hypothetical protein
MRFSWTSLLLAPLLVPLQSSIGPIRRSVVVFV